MTTTRSSGKKSSSKEQISLTPKSSTKKLKIEKDHNIEDLQDIANLLRIHTIEMCDASKSG